MFATKTERFSGLHSRPDPSFSPSQLGLVSSPSRTLRISDNSGRTNVGGGWHDAIEEEDIEKDEYQSDLACSSCSEEDETTRGGS